MSKKIKDPNKYLNFLKEQKRSYTLDNINKY